MKTICDLDIDAAVDAEAHLLNACRTQSIGWESEMAKWLSANSAWLERRCAMRLGSAADGEDAMQEITLKVLRSITSFEGRSTLRTWVTRIADNHCNSFLRQRASRAITAHLQHSIVLFESERYDEIDEQIDLKATVHHTLAKLTTKNREILQLRFFAELQLADIALSLGLSLSATKMRLYRAMDAFKKKHRVDSF